MALLCTFAALSYTWAQCGVFEIFLIVESDGTSTKTSKGCSDPISYKATYGDIVTFSVENSSEEPIDEAEWKVGSTLFRTASYFTLPSYPNEDNTTPSVYTVVVNGTSINISITVGKRFHKITFDSKEGSTVSEQEKGYYEKADRPTDPTRLGYKFLRWCLDGLDCSDEANEYDFDTPITRDITLNAEWEIIIYTITYDFDEYDCETCPGTYKITDLPLTLTEPTKEGYEFKGWFENSSFSGTAITTITESDIGNKDLYAKWEIEEYTITYNNTDACSGCKTTYTIVDLPLALPTNATKNGYTFVEWSPNSDLSGSIAEIPLGSTGNKTFYAKWTPTPYTITYNLDGGTCTTCTTTSYTIESGNITLPTTGLTKEGANFDKWVDESESEVTQIAAGSTGDKTFTAKWKAKEYTVTFNPNGGTPADGSKLSQTIEHGEKAEDPGDPTLDDYEFDGWDFDFANIPITEDKTINAKWKPIDYDITYELNGGTCTGCSAIDSYNVTELPKNLPAASGMSKTGYTFDGWFENESDFSDASKKLEKIPSGSTGDKKYYAKWDLITYNINYVLNSGTCTSACDAATYNIESSDITLPTGSDITREGYTFEGWYENSDLTTGGVVTAIATGSYGHKTFYAKWNLKTYNIIYNLYGGTGLSSDTYTVNDLPKTLQTTPTKTGYTFDGWFETSDLDDNGDSPITTLASISVLSNDTTFYAKWIANEYKITFDVNFPTGGVGSTPATPSDIDVEYDKAVSTLPTLSNITSHKFDGWKDEDGNIYTDVTVYKETRNITLYAQWTPNPYTISFDVNFPSGGEGTTPSTPSNITATFNTAVGALPTLSDITSHKFTGWFTATSGGTQYTAATIYTETTDITLYAQWEIKTFTVTFDSDGGTAVTKQTNITYKGTATKPDPDPTREGYTFDNDGGTTSGWQLNSSDFDFDTPITDDITLVAKWKANEWKISFNNNYPNGTGPDSNPDDIDVTYGKAVGSLPADPAAPTGYEFSGWYTTAAQTGGTKYETTTIYNINGNTTLYARWTPNPWTITFKTNFPNEENNNYEIRNVVFNGPVGNLTTGPTFAGYEFQGWYTATTDGTKYEETTYTTNGDTELYAQWKFIPGPPTKDMLDYTITSSKTYTGSPITDAVTPPTLKTGYPTPIGTITISYEPANPTNVGTYEIFATNAGNGYYTAATISLGFFEITQAPITLTSVTATAKNKTYDATTNAEIESIDFTFSAPLLGSDQSNISASDYSITNAKFNSANVNEATTVTGTVTILESGIFKNYNITPKTMDFNATANITQATGILEINPPENYELASPTQPAITKINPFVNPNIVTWEYKRFEDTYYLPAGQLPNRTGDWTVRASFPDDPNGNYTGAETTAQFHVTRGDAGAVEKDISFTNYGFTLDPELSSTYKKYYVAGTSLCNIKNTSIKITINEFDDVVLKRGIIPEDYTTFEDENKSKFHQYELSHEFGKPGLDTIIYTLYSKYEYDEFTEIDTILIETPIPFSNVTEQKWSNVLIVNNNPITNGGYEFTDFKWFKNNEEASLMQFYSEGPSSTDILNPNDTYKVTMKTAEGLRISTCEGNPKITVETQNATAQKASKQVLGINGKTTKQNPNAKVYNSKGERVNMPKPGVYIVTE